MVFFLFSLALLYILYVSHKLNFIMLSSRLSVTHTICLHFHFFLISNFRRVLNLVYTLLGISPASDCGLPTFRNPLSVPSSRLHTLHQALEDGTDRGFRNVGKPQSDAGEIPKRIHKIFLLIYLKHIQVKIQLYSINYTCSNIFRL